MSISLFLFSPQLFDDFFVPGRSGVLHLRGLDLALEPAVEHVLFCVDTGTNVLFPHVEVVHLYTKHRFKLEVTALIFSLVFHPCDKQVYCNRVQDFFPVKNFVHRMISNFKISLFSTFNILSYYCVYGLLDLLVKNLRCKIGRFSRLN